MIKRIFDRHGLWARALILAALGALLFVVPPARADDDCGNNFAHSGITWTGNSVAVVASDNVDSGGNLYYFWQKTGTGTWHRELVAAANGGTCPGHCTGLCPLVPWGYSSDAIAWTGDSIIIAAVDQRDGGLYYWWQAKDTSSWQQQRVAAGPPGCCSFGLVDNGVVTPSVFGYGKPSIAWTGKSVVLTACDHQGDLHYWFEEKGKATWYHELIAKGGCTWQPSIAWTGASVVIAATCNPNAALCYYWQAAGSGVWHRQVVDSAGDSPVSIAWTGNAVVIAAGGSGSSSSVVYYWQAAGTQTWHKQQVVGPSQSAFGVPTIAAAGGSVVIASGEEAPQKNRLDYWWAPVTNTGAWTLQNPSGFGDFSAWTDPGAIAWTGVSVVIISTTACGDLDYWFQQKSTTTWHKQRIVTNTAWPPGTC